jgi:hypothetical protein
LLLQPLSGRAGPTRTASVRTSERSTTSEESLSAPDPERAQSTPHKCGHKRRRRRLVVLIGTILCALVLLFGIVVGVMIFLTRDPSSPYRVGQALEQFKLLQGRDETSMGRVTRGLPYTGVYMYSTTGSESAHAPGLLASGAQYPHATAMTVFSQGCGQDWRWQPLTDRYEDLVVCRSSNGSLMLQSRFDAEQFYRYNDRRNFSCTSGSVFLPARPRPGEPFGGRCTNGGNTNSGGFAIGYSGEVVGTDVLEVGGTRVSTVHLVVNEKMTGDTVGTGTASLWLDSQTGLLVKETRTENTRSQSVVGWVPSAESFSLNLLSLDPKT